MLGRQRQESVAEQHRARMPASAVCRSSFRRWISTTNRKSRTASSDGAGLPVTRTSRRSATGRTRSSSAASRTAQPIHGSASGSCRSTATRRASASIRLTADAAGCRRGRSARGRSQSMRVTSSSAGNQERAADPGRRHYRRRAVRRAAEIPRPARVHRLRADRGSQRERRNAVAADAHAVGSAA